MNTMCDVCGSEQTELGHGYQCRICFHPFCQEFERKDNSALERDDSVWLCKSCSEKYAKESLRMDGFSPYATPLISPAISLTSFESCVSSCGDFQADMNSESRENGNEALDTGQEQRSLEYIEHSEVHKNGSSLKNIDIQCFDANNNGDVLGVPMSTEDNYASSSRTLQKHEDSNGEKVGPCNRTLEDVPIIRVGDDSDGAGNAIGINSESFISNIETDRLIWMPPEPEDREDDIECSVANNDDDDEYGDGTKWGQPSSLCGFDEEHGVSNSYKEERRKAMVEAMNGQFKFLVSRFLASEGIAISKGESGESWLDIVASLSWEAALLVKPDAKEGRAMDPGFYVKVKCIACGSRSQSQVIKGLVFKKNTTHKHMPTKCKNPRLLLLQGVLGQRAIGLQSFDSMEQEKDFLKSIIEMIETCHPNVVMVEKTVSRDAQESLLAKGITLVFDMKLSRLERIARCTGSPIISSADILMNPKLKQCDYFHIEKFVEEHNSSGEGEKRPSKTLMFFEGFPKPLGCTILLRGAHSDELKRVKRVVHYTVFAAYHLILETSFFADQRAIFSNMHTVEGKNSFSDKHVSFFAEQREFFSNLHTVEGKNFISDKHVPVVSFNTAPSATISNLEVSSAGTGPACTLNIPISDGCLEKSPHRGIYFHSDLDTEGISGTSLFPALNPDVHSHGNGLIKRGMPDQKCNGSEILQEEKSHDPSLPPRLPGFSASLRKVLGDGLPLGSTTSYEPIYSYFGFQKDPDTQSIDTLPVSHTLETLDGEAGTKDRIDHGKSHDGICDHENAKHRSDFCESLEHYSADVSSKAQIPCSDDIENVLDPQSILVLLSSQCISKGTVCEQSHLSRIKYYGNFDVSLGRFLQDILLNQKHSCSTCSESPEAHVYCYTHQNGKLTVLVRRLPPGSQLSGEAEGRIWMWTRCLKCESERGVPRSTRRVTMSNAARGLSFGKFLELSFSSHSAARRLSRCGHLLHRDCLRFFGLGSAVAMFRYSSVEIYVACKPPPVLEFNSLNGKEWINREARDVLQKGDHFFSEVASLLQKIKPRFSSQPVNYPGSVKEFSEVEEMLRQEKSEFEASLLIAMNYNGQLGPTVPKILGLPCLNQELLLELYVWDRRFHSLLSFIRNHDATDDSTQEKQLLAKKDDIPCNIIREEDMSVDGGKIEASLIAPINIEESSYPGSHLARNLSKLETKREINLAETSGDTTSGVYNSLDAEIAESPEVCNLIGASASGTSTDKGTTSVLDIGACTTPSALSSAISDHMQVDREIPFISEHLKHVEPDTNLDVQIDEANCSGEVFDKSVLADQHPAISVPSHGSRLEDPESWIWDPFSVIRMAYRKDLVGGYSQKFEFIHSYTPAYLSPKHQLIAQERDWLQFPVGADGNAMSVCEDEISSIIAYALALSQDQYNSSESTVEKEVGKDKGYSDKAIENIYSFTSDGSVASPFWSSTGSFDLEGIHPSQSFSSVSSDELSNSASEGSLFVDRLLSSENLHPEIHVGVGKAAGKSKYSVVCIHAKQFYVLRKHCCPSEWEYISSISRCKKWDAQGGKSKAFFAKSLDDRFIIKQVKKTELDSFLKFAPDYFKHISLSLSSGSQTCLAKILGIYQVRQTKNGKEVKTDLMVMENLLYGRNISRTYDLKGAVYSRFISDSNNPGRVLLDQNFVEDMRLSPMYVGGKTKHLLQRAIWNDTSFLTSINVMDYSLLVGVDQQRRELVFGIIDYLRQYTWDKQLETWVKASLVPKNALPTVVSPKEYKKRFRKFMSKYFLTVPNSWSSEHCSDPCKFCRDGTGDSSQLHCGKLPEKSNQLCA